MNPRREFLSAFFASLDANGVRFCVQRNYDALFEDGPCDIDLLVSRLSLARFRKCLRAAAAAHGFRLVHAARFVNFSEVFWHPEAGFVRIDFETEVRWRFFNQLSAREILDARVRRENFYVPDARHESVILFVAALWRGMVSERYRARLAQLYTACPDKLALQRALVESFGGAGVALAGFQANAATAEFAGAFCSRVRRSIVCNSLKRYFPATICHAVGDARRLFTRVMNPPGVALMVVASSERRSPTRRDDGDGNNTPGRRPALQPELSSLDILFPPAKCDVKTTDAAGTGSFAARFRVLFKGGLFARFQSVEGDESLRDATKSLARIFPKANSIIAVVDGSGRTCFAHIGRGFMDEVEPGKIFADAFTSFLCATQPPENPGRGKFCALVGLDGSGKTTLARNLCRIAGEAGFTGVRYFHWRPKCSGSAEFPLPEFRETARKPAPPRSALNTLLSTARVVKNILLTNAAYWLRVRPLVRRGHLVIVDRYFYNYFLDPASVKFSGPESLLDRAAKFFPKPDAVIALEAPKEVLLSRKRELADEEILKQAATLEAMHFDTPKTIRADSQLPPLELAHAVMAELRRESE